MKVALVVGHTAKSGGVINKASGISEFTFNSKLAYDIDLALSESEIDIEIVYRESYKDLPYKINRTNPDLIISLHCNAYNEEVSGTEVLYYHSSTKGKEWAEVLQFSIFEALGLTWRGTKPKHSEDRGGYLLKETNAPCLIVEPFFIDNDKDLATAFANYDKLVSSYVNSIKEILKC